MGMFPPLPGVESVEIKSGKQLLKPRLISLADMCYRWYARAGERGLRQTWCVEIPCNDQLCTPWCTSNSGVEGTPDFFTLALKVLSSRGVAPYILIKSKYNNGRLCVASNLYHSTRYMRMCADRLSSGKKPVDHDEYSRLPVAVAAVYHKMIFGLPLRFQ